LVVCDADRSTASRFLTHAIPDLAKRASVMMVLAGHP
jgi:hypothetical protein